MKFESKEIKPLPACVRCVHFRETKGDHHCNYPKWGVSWGEYHPWMKDCTGCAPHDYFEPRACENCSSYDGVCRDFSLARETPCGDWTSREEVTKACKDCKNWTRPVEWAGIEERRWCVGKSYPDGKEIGATAASWGEFCSQFACKACGNCSYGSYGNGKCRCIRECNALSEWFPREEKEENLTPGCLRCGGDASSEPNQYAREAGVSFCSTCFKQWWREMPFIGWDENEEIPSPKLVTARRAWAQATRWATLPRQDCPSCQHAQPTTYSNIHYYCPEAYPKGEGGVYFGQHDKLPCDQYQKKEKKQSCWTCRWLREKRDNSHYYKCEKIKNNAVNPDLYPAGDCDDYARGATCWNCVKLPSCEARGCAMSDKANIYNPACHQFRGAEQKEKIYINGKELERKNVLDYRNCKACKHESSGKMTKCSIGMSPCRFEVREEKSPEIQSCWRCRWLREFDHFSDNGVRGKVGMYKCEKWKSSVTGNPAVGGEDCPHYEAGKTCFNCSNFDGEVSGNCVKCPDDEDYRHWKNGKDDCAGVTTCCCHAWAGGEDKAKRLPPKSCFTCNYYKKDEQDNYDWDSGDHCRVGVYSRDFGQTACGRWAAGNTITDYYESLGISREVVAGEHPGVVTGSEVVETLCATCGHYDPARAWCKLTRVVELASECDSYEKIEAEKMKICEHCGWESPAGEVICGNCKRVILEVKEYPSGLLGMGGVQKVSLEKAQLDKIVSLLEKLLEQKRQMCVDEAIAKWTTTSSSNTGCERCPECGHDYPPFVAYCGQCGLELNKPTVYMKTKQCKRCTRRKEDCGTRPEFDCAEFEDKSFRKKRAKYMKRHSCAKCQNNCKGAPRPADYTQDCFTPQGEPAKSPKKERKRLSATEHARVMKKRKCNVVYVQGVFEYGGFAFYKTASPLPGGENIYFIEDPCLGMMECESLALAVYSEYEDLQKKDKQPSLWALRRGVKKKRRSRQKYAKKLWKAVGEYANITGENYPEFSAGYQCSVRHRGEKICDYLNGKWRVHVKDAELPEIPKIDLRGLRRKCERARLLRELGRNG